MSIIRFVRLLAAVVLLAAAPPSLLFAADSAFDIRGHVVDSSGAVIIGASVTLHDAVTGAGRQTVTDGTGEFVFAATPPGRYTVVALAAGFVPSAVDVDPAALPRLTLTLDPAPVNEQITVASTLPDAAVVSTATRIAASPMDIPQTIDAVPQALLRAQAARSMQDALRNVPGVTPNLGEGRRDQFLIRGFSAQGDTLVDGVRDDALYYRDLSTIERVEVLKGPASALFGRGSSGGVINRVSKRPRLDRPVADAAIMLGGFDTRRISFDAGQPTAGRRAAYRVAGAWESSGSFRDFGSLSRMTVAPSVTGYFSSSTSVTAQTELLHDRRVPDRGIPSVDGRPADVRISQYYGSPQDDFIRSDVLGTTITAEHQFQGGWLLRNVVREARYDTSWSNTQPIDVKKTATGVLVKRSQYNADQRQHNLFDQAEMIGGGRFGGMTHVMLAGVEAGLQRRNVVRFNGIAPDVALVEPVLTSPAYSTVAATDNQFDGTVAGVYVQDLISLGTQWKALVSIRPAARRSDVEKRRPLASRHGDEPARRRCLSTHPPGVAVFEREPIVPAVRRRVVAGGQYRRAQTRGDAQSRRRREAVAGRRPNHGDCGDLPAGPDEHQDHGSARHDASRPGGTPADRRFRARVRRQVDEALVHPRELLGSRRRDSALELGAERRADRRQQAGAHPASKRQRVDHRRRDAGVDARRRRERRRRSFHLERQPRDHARVCAC